MELWIGLMHSYCDCNTLYYHCNTLTTAAVQQHCNTHRCVWIGMIHSYCDCNTLYYHCNTLYYNCVPLTTTASLLLPLQHSNTATRTGVDGVVDWDDAQLLRLQHTLQHTLQHCNMHRCVWSLWIGMLRSYCDCNTLTTMATHCNTAKTQVLEQLWMGMMHNVDGLASAAMREGTHLQHTATHCNTLQHTAPHCNTLISLQQTDSNR